MPDADKRVTWFDRNPGKAKLIMAVIVVLVLEIFARVLVVAGLIPYQPYPTSRYPEFIDHMDREVGRWHYPNADVDVYDTCKTGRFVSNGVGAMDIERATDANDAFRVAVVGDSFAAGYYVSFGERFTGLLEERTGIEHLNFAVSGTGTVHQSQVYRYKASEFEHDAVIVAVLPVNDFENNRADAKPGKKYQPTVREVDGELEIYYPVRYEDRYIKERSFGERLKNRIDNTLYLMNALRLGSRVFKGWRRGEQLEDFAEQAPNYYDNYDENDWRLMEFALREIVAVAGDKPVVVVTLPYAKDIDYARTQGYNFRLVRQLSEFAAANKTVYYLDLLPGFAAAMADDQRDYQSYVWACDMHWNPDGHDVAAELMYQGLAETLYSGE